MLVFLTRRRVKQKKNLKKIILGLDDQGHRWYLISRSSLSKQKQFAFLDCSLDTAPLDMVRDK